MKKYQVIKDIKVVDTVILKEGEEIELVSENDGLIVNTPFGQIQLSFDSMKSSLREKETIQISIIPLEEEDIIKEYRLQLDVKTTRKKAREIENYLRETLERMI